jgi:thioredoxin
MIDITTATDLQEQLQTADHTYVLDFYADWCSPCKQMLRILPSIEPKIEGKGTILKINTETQPDLAKQYAVRSIPTFVLIKNNQEVGRFVGVTPIRTLTEAVLEIER